MKDYTSLINYEKMAISPTNPNKLKHPKELKEKSNYLVYVYCSCCGEERTARMYTVSSGNASLCKKCTSVKHNDIGVRYGKLTVKSIVDGGNRLCACDCGNEKIIDGYSLRHGTTKSCGCYVLKMEEHPNWKGGVSGESQMFRSRKIYKDWRNFVFERDGYTCAKCGVVGGELNAHHIKPFSICEEGRTDIDNGITLCKKCHTQYHRIHGILNNNLEQFNDWINTPSI